MYGSVAWYAPLRSPTSDYPGGGVAMKPARIRIGGKGRKNALSLDQLVEIAPVDVFAEAVDTRSLAAAFTDVDERAYLEAIADGIPAKNIARHLGWADRKAAALRMRVRRSGPRLRKRFNASDFRRAGSLKLFRRERIADGPLEYSLDPLGMEFLDIMSAEWPKIIFERKCSEPHFLDTKYRRTSLNYHDTVAAAQRNAASFPALQAAQRRSDELCRRLNQLRERLRQKQVELYEASKAQPDKQALAMIDKPRGQRERLADEVIALQEEVALHEAANREAVAIAEQAAGRVAVEVHAVIRASIHDGIVSRLAKAFEELAAAFEEERLLMTALDELQLRGLEPMAPPATAGRFDAWRERAIQNGYKTAIGNGQQPAKKGRAA